MFAKYSAIRTVLSYTVIPALNLMGLGLEEIARSSNEAFAELQCDGMEMTRLTR
jgi:hypothetical protein